MRANNNKGGSSSQPSAAELPSPQVFGDKNYKILKEIGSGSFGKAYLCDIKGKKYVMKRINMKELSDEEKQGALLEAQILQKLKHDNIIAYKEYFISSDKYLNIVMDYADGGDLFSKIKNSPSYFSEDQILDWFTQIALGLKHVHDCNILHRDLKTQNIFLTKSGKITIGDFGIAKILNSQTEFANTVIGTPYYLSPELCEDKPYNQKSDVWALGCVLYELTTRKHAFNGQNLPALVLKILKGTYPPIPPVYSSNLSDLISSMLQKDPDLRPSMSEILSLPFIQERVFKFILNKQQSAQNVSKPSSSLEDISKQEAASNNPRSVTPQNQPNEAQGNSDQKVLKKDPKWLEEKQREMDALFKQLHPSKQVPIDTLSKLQIRKHMEERKELKKEKLKGRKEYYEQLLEKKIAKPSAAGVMVSASAQNQPVASQQQAIPPRVSLPSNILPSKAQPTTQRQSPPQVPSSETKTSPKRNEDRPRPSKSQDDNEKTVYSLEEILNQQRKPPVKTKSSEPNGGSSKSKHSENVISKEEQRKDIKNKQDSERQKWLNNMNGNEAEDRKKKFLEEKKEEKRRRKEEEKRLKLEHKKKMDAIKGRKNQVRQMFGLDDGAPSVDDSQSFKKQEEAHKVMEPTEVELLKKKEEEEKERKRREQLEKQRQDFKEFIKNQKKKKKEDEIPVEIAIPHISESSKRSHDQNVDNHSDLASLNEQNTPKKQSSSQGKNVEVLIVESKPKHELVQAKSSPSKIINSQFEDLDLLPSKEGQSQPPTFDRNNGTPVELKFHTPIRKHEIDTSQLSPTELENLRKKQNELGVRIESLRSYCENKFGERTFMELYNFLRDFEFKENEDEDSQVHDGISRILGEEKSRLMPYIQKIHQLLFCEDLFYG